MKVKVRDNQTGVIIEVDESELGQYGLGAAPSNFPTPTPTPQPVAPAAPVAPPEKSLLQGNVRSDNLFSGDSLLFNVINSVAKPFVKTGKNVAAVGFEGARMADMAINPGNERATQDDPFINEEDFSNGLKSKGFTDQVKNSAAVASWAIPFGRAGFTGSKFIAPGAGVGAAQSLPDAQNAEDVVKAGVLGGVTGGGLQLGGKVLSKVLGVGSKVSPTLETGAQKLEQGTRKIRVKPSVYGAGEEKAINKTLTKYRVEGSPQAQYDALEPTMGKVEAKIQEIIKTNPEISVSRADIKQSFINSLKSSVRSGEITQKQAVTETEKYLKDLLKASGGTGKFTNINLEKLRALKKLINEDYKGVYAITSNPMSPRGLTPKQKVIEAAWDSLDDAVKNASPEMKVLLKDESNLYKSAQSISAARSNPPTFRFMGSSVPAEVTQKGKDVLTKVLRGGSEATAGVSDMSSGIRNSIQSPALKTVLGQGVTRLGAEVLPQVSSNGNNQPYNEQNYNDTQNLQDTSIIPQTETPQTNYVTGYSPEELYAGYLAANQAGDSASAKQLKTMYDDEIAFQKTQGSTSKPIPAVLKQRMDLSTAGLRARQDAEDLFRQDPNIVIKKTISGGILSRKFDSAMSRAVEGLLRARSGAAVPDSEVKKYIRDYGPRIGDSEEVALYKLQQLKLDLEDALNNNGNVGADYTTAVQ